MYRARSHRIAGLVAAAACVLAPATAAAYPPNVPTKTQAQSELNSLTVRGEDTMSGYSREKFPTWRSSGGCTVRQQVLKRDGRNVRTDRNCQPTSGSWYSEFDGVTRSEARQISIDHIVPLAEAWRSGAQGWDAKRREDFANDLEGPELIAVTTEVNSAKGDRDPAGWMPPLADKHCAYSKFWIRTKSRWGLTLQQSEKSALQKALNTCGN